MAFIVGIVTYAVIYIILNLRDGLPSSVDDLVEGFKDYRWNVLLSLIILGLLAFFVLTLPISKGLPLLVIKD